MLWNTFGFIVAIGILVTIHEYGHFIIARWNGVRVLRFSVGFGQVLWRRFDRHGTEFTLCAIPLGGYVKMLNQQESEDPLTAEEQASAYDNKKPWRRIAIASAGPIANFLFAILALWCMYIVGVTALRPVVGYVEEASIASEAGLVPGDTIVAMNGERIVQWSDMQLHAAGQIGDGEPIQLEVMRDGYTVTKYLRTERWKVDPAKQDIMRSLGVAILPPLPPLLDKVIAEGAGARSGLMSGDRVISIDSQNIDTWEQFVQVIKAHPEQPLLAVIERQGQLRELTITPGRKSMHGENVGYLGVSPLIPDASNNVVFQRQYGAGEAVAESFKAFKKLCAIQLVMIKKLLTGKISADNIGGPLSIAEGAGASARGGVASFLYFLAFLSIILGVMNLLPVPVLDGGHILFDTYELIFGKPLPQGIQWVAWYAGIAIIGSLMIFAIYNDLTR